MDDSKKKNVEQLSDQPNSPRLIFIEDQVASNTQIGRGLDHQSSTNSDDQCGQETSGYIRNSSINRLSLTMNRNCEEVIELDAIHSRDSSISSNSVHDGRLEGGDFSAEDTDRHILESLSRHLPSRTPLTEIDDTSKMNNKFKMLKLKEALRLRYDYLSPESCAARIVKHFEAQEDVMEDDPMAEIQRMKALREIPQHLTVKRAVKAKLTNSVNNNSKKKVLNCWKRLGYALSIYLLRLTQLLKSIEFTTEIWYDEVKSIESHFGSGVVTYFKFLRWILSLNVINLFLSLIFITVPHFIYQWGCDFISMDFSNLCYQLVRNTLYSYGYNANDTINYISKYELRKAYILTMICCYMLTFALMCYKVTRSYRKCYIETFGGTNNLYASKVFCSWDYSIATFKAAEECSLSIFRELKELLEEAKIKNLEARNRFSNFLNRLGASFLMIILTLAFGGITGLVMHDSKINQVPEVPTTVITFMVVSVPCIITYMAKLEKYTTIRSAVSITIIRSYMVIVVILIVFIKFSLDKCCWKIDFVQNIMRLMAGDFILFSFGNYFWIIIRFFLNFIIKSNAEVPPFDLVHISIHLIYIQILFWLVFYLSPPSALLIVLMVLITFYLKKHSLMNLCKSPTVAWRAAQTETLLLALTFLGMTGVVALTGYIITNNESSCDGPYAGYENTSSVMITDVLGLEKNSLSWNIMTYLTKPGIGKAVLILMSIAVYFFRTKANANKKKVQVLHEIFDIQTQDREFLLREFSKLISDKGEDQGPFRLKEQHRHSL